MEEFLIKKFHLQIDKILVSSAVPGMERDSVLDSGITIDLENVTDASQFLTPLMREFSKAGATQFLRSLLQSDEGKTGLFDGILPEITIPATPDGQGVPVDPSELLRGFLNKDKE